jgi:long-chain acyl-CoA synthetase
MWETPQWLVQDSLLAAAAETPDKEAVVDEGEERSFARLRDDALSFARALQDAGLKRGDRVALYLDNTVAFPTALFGTLFAGGVFTMVSAQTKLDKLCFILRDCEASFVVADGRSAALATEAARRTPSVRRVYATPGDLPDGVEDLEATIAATPSAPGPVPTIPVDLAALVYTSGTTGRPKGVMLSHQALVFVTGSIVEYLRLTPEDRLMNILPLTFTYGLSHLLLTVRLGATLLLERNFAFPAKTLRRLRESRATVFPAVPTVFATIIGMEHEAPFEDVRCLTNAAAGLPPATHAGIRRLFPNANLFRMYGQTECIRICYLEPEDIERKPTSIGHAIPGTELSVLGEDGRPVGPGEVGVLHVRGPHLMMGYWHAPEMTAETLLPGPYPGERLHCTHDYFTVDDEGSLYFVDRSDDIIKTRGEKVSSVEVENALHDIPGVRQAAVIGVPDELLGMAIRAYVVPHDDVRLTAADIVRACRARLEPHMVPRRVELVRELPQTDSGKVRKKTLVEALPSAA